MKNCALFLSPHLDDVVFSCGGTLAKMAEENWTTILCTAFTKSVPHPQGFALACQLDKNLAPDADYMKLRRREDFRAAEILGAADVVHLNIAEAPHRGYQSAQEFFAGIRTGDDIWQIVAEHFALLDEIHQPEIVFAPQGLGGHCDHLQTIRAALNIFAPQKLCWYRDTPYAIRQPEASPNDTIPVCAKKTACDISKYLERKIAACAAYETQINFQFGGIKKLPQILRDFHLQEAKPANTENQIVENFMIDDPSKFPKLFV